MRALNCPRTLYALTLALAPILLLIRPVHGQTEIAKSEPAETKTAHPEQTEAEPAPPDPTQTEGAVREVAEPAPSGGATAQVEQAEPAVFIVQRPGGPQHVRDLIIDAAHRWGLNEGVMLRVAWCESRWLPNASNPSGAAGVFQFMPRTWVMASAAVGMAGASPFDARANVEAASWLYRTQGPRHWTCK